MENIATDADNTGNELSTRTALSLIVLIFISASLLMSLVYYSFPQIDESEREFIKFPKNIDDAKKLGEVLYR